MMVQSKVQNTKFDRCRGEIFNFGINLIMALSKIKSLKFCRRRGRIVNFELVPSKIQNSTAAAVECRFLDYGIF